MNSLPIAEGDAMKIAIILSSVLFPLMMFFLQNMWIKFRFIFTAGAIISTLIFGNIASLSIYSILRDETVFMTNIHAVFLNPLFLATGGYIGIYILYRLILVMKEEGQDGS